MKEKRCIGVEGENSIVIDRGFFIICPVVTGAPWRATGPVFIKQESFRLFASPPHPAAAGGMWWGLRQRRRRGAVRSCLNV